MVLLAALQATAQKAENVIIITTDGFRWQELFGGIDESIAANKRYNQGDSADIFRRYWAADAVERRKKLMPFLWSTVAEKGRIYGNRAYGNNVNVANPYWFSYPGYSEIMCGYVDTAINSNEYKPNPNTTLLEFLNSQPTYRNRVAAFTAWEAFNRILNEGRSGIPVVAAYDRTGGSNPTANEKMINAMLTDSHREWSEECFDVFTHYAAMEHLSVKKPRVMYISYGETDEWAHAGSYRSYLDAAHRFDGWLRQVWEKLQADPQYRGKTSLFITTDHGRGDKQKEKWTSHGSSVEGADQIWFAAMGPGIQAGGEMKKKQQIFQKQFAQTIAGMLGITYKASHPVAEGIAGLIMK